MRAQGKITDWDDLRGFGFILPLELGERVFVHISAFRSGSRRPTDGDFVNYTPGTDERGRPCATQVTYVVGHAKPSANGAQARNLEPIAALVAMTFLGVVVILAITEYLWWQVPCIYIVMSMVAYSEYKNDKHASEIGARRTPEENLIILALIGGWPGALIARHRFHHKTRKVAFQIGYWISVVLNVAGLAWLIAGGSSRLFSD